MGIVSNLPLVGYTLDACCHDYWLDKLLSEVVRDYKLVIVLRTSNCSTIIPKWDICITSSTQASQNITEERKERKS